MQVLLKKTLHISKVDSIDGDDYVTDDEWITNDLYWLYEVGKVSIHEAPVGWKCFDSLDELNANFGTTYEEKDAKDFYKTLEKKAKDLEKWLIEIWYTND